MFSHVIVKTPCTAMVHGITGHPELGAPDYEKALEQHRAYIETLRQCGVDVTVLPADEAYPDSCFVEDAAVLTKYCAVITNPGAPSRKGETAAIEPAVAEFYPPDKIFHILPGGEHRVHHGGHHRGRRRDDVRRYLLCRALRAHQP